MTSRRQLLAALAAGISLPRILLAQAARMKNVAVLFIGDSDDDEPAAKPFFEAMTRFGWIEGKNISYDRHSGKGTRQYVETMVSNATGSDPDLIFATTGGLAAAVLRDNASLPVVFVTMNDPVAGGLVASLAKPGRNATGSFQMPGDAAPKRFALVRQAIPGLKRMGAVFDRNNADTPRRLAAHLKAAKSAGIELAASEFTNFEAIAKIFAQYKRDGVLVAEMTPSFALTGRRREVVALAERNDIALVAHRAEWADAGAILTYGVDLGENYRRAAAIANRILKGANPGNIAVELPNRLELVLNPKAALVFGIAMPKALLKQANRVIA
ncbi:MAG TPA: ABC transporter substrate-binding protein [Burkholderiales bacterium]|nr:ABC transporter substrate-binding protein [Burkholderiales bacterium]